MFTDKCCNIELVHIGMLKGCKLHTRITVTVVARGVQ